MSLSDKIELDNAMSMLPIGPNVPHQQMARPDETLRQMSAVVPPIGTRPQQSRSKLLTRCQPTRLVGKLCLAHTRFTPIQGVGTR